VAGGRERWFRLEDPGLQDWQDARGEIYFTDIDGGNWKTAFSVQVARGGLLAMRVDEIVRD
jgi:hypothetical protein